MHGFPGLQFYYFYRVVAECDHEQSSVFYID